MEIKNVENYEKNNYPKLNELNKSKIKKSIPNRWAKIGISSFVFSFIMKTFSFAEINPSDITSEGVSTTSGITESTEDIVPSFLQDSLPLIIRILSIIIFIVTGINLLSYKIKAKKSQESVTESQATIGQPKTVVQILFKISILAFVISILYSCLVYFIFD